MANNLYPNCPPLMADGRHITDYSPRCLQELLVKDDKGNPLTSYMYRQYLMSNGDKLIGDMQNDTFGKFGCAACAEPPVPQAENVQSCTQNTCAFMNGPGDGLGLTRFSA